MPDSYRVINYLGGIRISTCAERTSYIDERGSNSPAEKTTALAERSFCGVLSPQARAMQAKARSAMGTRA